MADPVYIEVVLGGSRLVQLGAAASILLEEELNAASQITVELVPGEARPDVLSAVTFGASVTVELGSSGNPTRTVACKVCETEDELAEDGQWRYVFRAVDDLIRLKHQVKSRVFEVSPSAVLQQIGSDMGWSATLAHVEPYTQPILQNNETNAAFVRRLATEYGYTVSLDGTSLYIGRAADAAEVTLGPDDGIQGVRIRRSLLGIPSDVQVIGYDWKSTQGAVQGKAAGGDLVNVSQGSTAPDLVKQTWGAVVELVESGKLIQQGDTGAAARGLLQRRADQFLTGELQCLGNPDIRPGRKLIVEDMGTVTGTYRVRSTRHVFDPTGGYRTTVRFYSDGIPKEGE